MKPPLLIAALFLACAFSGLPVHGQTAGCSFPGSSHDCPDSTGRRVISWHEPSVGTPHELWLRSVGDGQRFKLIQFDRSVGVLWSPNGHSLAITDHSGSSESKLLVAMGGNLQRLANVETALRASFVALPDIFKNGHRNFEAVRWLRPNTLLFKVRAYDSDPNKEYAKTFQYNLNGRVTESSIK